MVVGSCLEHQCFRGHKLTFTHDEVTLATAQLVLEVESVAFVQAYHSSVKDARLPHEQITGLPLDIHTQSVGGHGGDITARHE